MCFRRNCKTLYEFVIRISGCVGDGYDAFCLLGCDAMWLRKLLRTFLRRLPRLSAEEM
jgi:hypothetical protein